MGGATMLPLTIAGERWGRFVGSTNEAADESEAGATYYLAVTLLGGALTYRVAQ